MSASSTCTVHRHVESRAQQEAGTLRSVCCNSSGIIKRLLVGLATAGMAFFGRPRGKDATTKNSTEDAEGLLNTLLMLCTFTLGFSVSFIAIYNYDDLQEMDRRFASDWHSGLDGSQWIGDSWTLDKTYTWLPSTTIAFSSFISTSLLSISLVVSLGT